MALFSLVHMPLSNTLSVHYSTWTSYVNVTILQKYSGNECACAQAVCDCRSFHFLFHLIIHSYTTYPILNFCWLPIFYSSDDGSRIQYIKEDFTLIGMSICNCIIMFFKTPKLMSYFSELNTTKMNDSKLEKVAIIRDIKNTVCILCCFIIISHTFFQ